MIKVTLPFNERTSKREQEFWDMHKWMLATFGKEIPRRPDCTKQRRAWSMKANYWGGQESPSGYIDVFVRKQEWASMIILRWK